MSIQGTGLRDKNVRLRFFGIIFLGVIAFASVLYWRQATITNAEYVGFDIPKSTKKHPSFNSMKSDHYQLEVEETNPTAN